MSERTASIVWWINEDTPDSAGEILFERLESKKVVPEDESIVENIVAGDTV